MIAAGNTQIELAIATMIANSNNESALIDNNKTTQAARFEIRTINSLLY